MRKYFKLGCNWGSGKSSFYNFIKQQNIVIGVSDKKYKIGDIIAVTEGHLVNALVKITSLPSILSDKRDYSEGLQKFDVSLEDWVEVYNGEWYELSNNDRFKYQLQQGIVEIQNETIKTTIARLELKRMQEMKIEETVNVLKHKKQIILQGAPGTGKTYISAEIALKLIGEDTSSLSRDEIMKLYNDKVESGQIAFTTFHQSIDYEEFVEGLKPVTTKDGKITYSVQPGIFKRICEKANSNTIEGAIKDIFSTYNASLNGIKFKGKDYHIEYKSMQLHIHYNNIVFYVDHSSENNEFSWHQSSKSGTQGKCSFDELFNSKSEDCDDLIRHKIVSIIKEVLLKYTSRAYVLLIDEINRGNISKILGELITLLEADKRLGADNQITVKLPYTHAEKPNAPEFGIPDNLYIIGTMNTADRSVGHIDYAIRRRFAFVTLESERNAIENYYVNLKNDDSPKEQAINLFSEVEKIFTELTPEFDKADLMVGHSYFMAESKKTLQLKLKYEIQPLLVEYVKDGILKENALSFIGKLSI